EQALRRALPKNIVDDLNRTHAGVLDGLHAFLDPLDADSVVPQLPSLYQVVQDPENLGAIIDFCGRTMELQQVESFEPKMAQRVFQKRRQVGSVVARSDVGVQPAPGFAR